MGHECSGRHGSGREAGITKREGRVRAVLLTSRAKSVGLTPLTALASTRSAPRAWHLEMMISAPSLSSGRVGGQRLLLRKTELCKTTEYTRVGKAILHQRVTNSWERTVCSTQLCGRRGRKEHRKHNTTGHSWLQYDALKTLGRLAKGDAVDESKFDNGTLQTIVKDAVRRWGYKDNLMTQKPKLFDRDQWRTVSAPESLSYLPNMALTRGTWMMIIVMMFAIPTLYAELLNF
eukprot:3650475-Prymnesium_polylepis.1